MALDSGGSRSGEHRQPGISIVIVGDRHWGRGGCPRCTPRPALDGGRHCPVLLIIHCGDPIGGGSTTDSHRGRPRGAMSPTVLKPTFTVTGLTGAGLAMMVNTTSSPPSHQPPLQW
ncbi:MAG: hypothetical protein OXC96_07265 [Cyanobacteria bacterium MAG CAR1_bin_15]|nr:hypothetical protein [Cyanobacteria bacterium MAG CAR1_bin_15]